MTSLLASITMHDDHMIIKAITRSFEQSQLPQALQLSPRRVVSMQGLKRNNSASLASSCSSGIQLQAQFKLFQCTGSENHHKAAPRKVNHAQSLLFSEAPVIII
jgi:hypothetical protein